MTKTYERQERQHLTWHSQKRGWTRVLEVCKNKKIWCKLAERSAKNTANLRDVLPF